MNNDDERDHEEEAANKRFMLEEMDDAPGMEIRIFATWTMHVASPAAWGYTTWDELRNEQLLLASVDPGMVMETAETAGDLDIGMSFKEKDK